MKSVLVLGAGKIGRMVTYLLGSCGDYQVTVADSSRAHADQCAASDAGVVAEQVSFDDCAALARVMKGKWAVVSCAPYRCNTLIAKCAKEAGAHYLDLTEDVGTTKAVKALAVGSKSALIPQCGLAPGYISIVAHHLSEGLSPLLDLRLGVGALPRNPTNRLKYNLTWSTDGLINEYCNPCEAICEGENALLQPLEHLESFMLSGTLFEAFNTSGGLGSLSETYQGRVRNLTYKTIRYPGHCELMKFLIKDLRFLEHKADLATVFNRAIPATDDDVVVVFVTATGNIGGRLVERTAAKQILGLTLGGRHWTAIQLTTAAGICAMVDLLDQGKIPAEGFVRMEDVNYQDFITNRFGRHYA
ncbi:MAG: saccharopine dehydrogenase family protein [Phycisphaerales bacterium]|nr:saccharopine dehydrogenase family protein [Phycisphaerales bacterium]